MSEIPGFFDFAGLYDRVVRDAPPGSLLVEVGVYRGKSLVHLARAARSAAKGLRVVGVDWCLGDAGVGVQDPGECAGLIVERLHERNVAADVALIVAASPRAAELFADGSVWFAFIDAAHDRASVVSDLAAWRPKIASGGVLAGHDAGYPTVAGPVREAFGDVVCPSPDAPNCWEVRL